MRSTSLRQQAVSSLTSPSRWRRSLALPSTAATALSESCSSVCSHSSNSSDSFCAAQGEGGGAGGRRERERWAGGGWAEWGGGTRGVGVAQKRPSPNPKPNPNPNLCAVKGRAALCWCVEWGAASLGRRGLKVSGGGMARLEV
eukprot:scaffold32940_cov44-Phaeocystis_antarctica.AAC.1